MLDELIADHMPIIHLTKFKIFDKMGDALRKRVELLIVGVQIRYRKRKGRLFLNHFELLSELDNC